MDPHLSLLHSNVDSLEFCTALAAIGRTNAALVAAAAAAESATAPEAKNEFLALLARLLGSRRPTTEAATNRAVFGGARALTPSWPRPPTADTLSLFTAAGQFIHPLSYAAAVVDDRRRAREVGPAMAASDPTKLNHLLVEAVAAGGPIEEVARAFSPGATAWLKKARTAATSVAPGARATLAHIRWAAAETCALFALRRASECWHAASAALEALDSYMPRNRRATVQGALDYEAISVAAVAAHCIDSKMPSDRLEALVAALVRPRDTHFSLPLRGAFYFTACGHAYRHLACQRGEHVTITFSEDGAVSLTAMNASDLKNELDATCLGATNSSEAIWSATHSSATTLNAENLSTDSGAPGESAKPQVGLLYNRETAIEAARKYIIAAATLALDDPELPRRYDRVLWCLILGGDINIATLWPFLVARARAEVDLFTAPVAECALYPEWPCYKNGPEILSRLFDSCLEFPRRTDLLLPTFVEVDDSVLVADGFYPTVLKFVRASDLVVSPVPRSHHRHLPRHFSEENEGLLDLWTEVYCENHGEVPDDIADAIGEKYLRSLQTC